MRSTNANTRTLENCSRRACTSSSVKWLNPATEPDTSQSITSSGRAGRRLAQHQVASARRRSTSTCAASGACRSAPARLPAPHREPGGEAPGQRCTVRRSWASCSADAGRNSTCSISFGTRIAHLVAAEQLGGAAPRLVLDHLAEVRDPRRSMRSASCSWRGRRARRRSRQQPGEQLLQGRPAPSLQRLVLGARRPAAGRCTCRLPRRSRRPSPPAARPGGEVFVLAEQARQHRPAARRRRRPASSARRCRGVPSTSPSSPNTVRAPSAAGHHRSKRASKVSRWSARRSTAQARPSRSCSRSTRSSAASTRPASTVSDGPTAMPCRRRASTNSTR